MNEITDPNSEVVRNLDVAEEVNRLHQENFLAARDTIFRAIRIGELLVQKKASLSHGEWIPWFIKNITFSLDTYDNYRRVYERQEELRLANIHKLKDAYTLIRNASRQKKEPKAKVQTDAVKEVCNRSSGRQ